MKPILITAHLYSGFATSDQWSPAIDGILAYWHIQQRYGADNFNIQQGLNHAMQTVNDLPLEKIDHNDLWWYAASSPIYHTCGVARRYLHRRFDQSQAEKTLPDNMKKVQVQSGAFKNARMAINHIVTDKVTWHVIGELNAIKTLLKHANHIGAKYGAGFGRVREWTYDDGDEQLARHYRPLPIEYAQQHGIVGDKMTWGIRPPARLIENCVDCIMPFNN